MKIFRLDQDNLDQSVNLIIESFADQYKMLFAIEPVRLKAFVEHSLKTDETWVFEDGVVKGVLALTHQYSKDPGFLKALKVLVKCVPLWSVVYAARYILAPRVKIPYSIHVSQIAVSDHFRNQGIGLKLLEFAQFRAKELGFDSLNLRVRADNPAVNLYKSFGFATFKELNSAILSSVSGCRSSLVMVKNLVP